MCVDQWQASYVNGDLNERKTLCEALSYRNFDNSPDYVRTIAVQVLQGLDCAKAMEGGVFRPSNIQCCLGEKSPFEGTSAYLVISKKDLFPTTSGAVIPPEYMLEPLRNGIRRNVLFISDWCDNNGAPVLPGPDQVDCGALAEALGMYGSHWRQGSEIAIFSLKITHAHKSTWLDSGLAFYWYATPNLPRWGLTRSLKSGCPTLREWVIPRQNGDYDITAYWRRTVAHNCEPPNDDYWNACIQELRS